MAQDMYYKDPELLISIASWHDCEGILETWQDYYQQCEFSEISGGEQGSSARTSDSLFTIGVRVGYIAILVLLRSTKFLLHKIWFQCTSYLALIAL